MALAVQMHAARLVVDAVPIHVNLNVCNRDVADRSDIKRSQSSPASAWSLQSVPVNAGDALDGSDAATLDQQLQTGQRLV